MLSTPITLDKTIEELQVRRWTTPRGLETYPELCDKRVRKRSSLGFAFRGGGTRAAAAAVGQLRMLEDWGWTKHARYISAISGGAWAVVPYTFLRDEPGATETFLGKYVMPSELPISMLTAEATLNRGDMLFATSNAKITQNYLKAVTDSEFDETYAAALNAIFLEPFNLHDRLKFFSWRKEDVRKAVKANSDVVSEKHFFLVEQERPFLIVGGTLLESRFSSTGYLKHRIEMTPLYTGVPDVGKLPGSQDESRVRGRGFIESAGYDMFVSTERPEQQGQRVTAKTDPYRVYKNRLRFTLSDVLAITGAAPQETILKLPVLNILTGQLGFPEHYSIAGYETDDGRVVNGMEEGRSPPEFAHGDGGHVDNLGLMPLFARRVENILAFVNSNAPIDEEAFKNCGSALSDPLLRNSFKGLEPCRKMMDRSLASHFVATESKPRNVSLRMNGKDSKSPSEFPVESHLAGYRDLHDLTKSILTKNDSGDSSLVQCRPFLSVRRANDNWDSTVIVDKAYNPNICFVWLGKQASWFSKVNDATQTYPPRTRRMIQRMLDLDKRGVPTKPQFRPASPGFPHTGTALDHTTRVIELSAARSVALSNFTAWVLEENREQLNDFFHSRGAFRQTLMEAPEECKVHQ